MAALSLSAFTKGLGLVDHRRPLTSIAAPVRRTFSLTSIKCSLYHRACSSFVKYAASEVSGSQSRLMEGADDEACELVNGVELILGEGTDSFRAYLLKAVKNNNGMGVLLLTDIHGFEDSCTRDFAYRVACTGYNVLVPDLFRGDPWTKDRPKVEFDKWLSRQSPERVAKDIAKSTQWMREEFVAADMSGKLGIIGFCFGGGRLVETLASDHDVYFGIGVCFYGTRLNESLADNIKVPVLFISGKKDPLCPVEVLHEMEKRIKGSRVVLYAERGHGFAHRPEYMEEDEDAEDAFAVMRNWLHNGLVVKN